jgi:hypothetical protein
MVLLPPLRPPLQLITSPAPSLTTYPAKRATERKAEEIENVAGKR